MYYKVKLRFIDRHNNFPRSPKRKETYHLRVINSAHLNSRSRTMKPPKIVLSSFRKPNKNKKSITYYALGGFRCVFNRRWRLIVDLNEHMCKPWLSHNNPCQCKILWVLGGIRKPTRELHIQNEKEVIRPPVDLSLFNEQGRIWMACEH